MGRGLKILISIFNNDDGSFNSTLSLPLDLIENTVLIHLSSWGQVFKVIMTYIWQSSTVWLWDQIFSLQHYLVNLWILSSCVKELDLNPVLPFPLIQAISKVWPTAWLQSVTLYKLFVTLNHNTNYRKKADHEPRYKHFEPFYWAGMYWKCEDVWSGCRGASFGVSTVIRLALSLLLLSPLVLQNTLGG